MRMSELSRATGVPVATIKYYLRQGLLPAGRPTAATQAEYDEAHVQRLRLVRALVDVGGLSLTAAKAVTDALDAGDGLYAGVSAAHDALPPAADRTAAPERAAAALRVLGWEVDPESAGLFQLDAALAAVEAVGLPAGEERLRAYAAAALAVARIDVGTMPPGDPAEAVRFAVVGTVMYEPVLLALRRLAQQVAFRTVSEPGYAAPPEA